MKKHPLVAIPCRITGNRIPEFPHVSSVWRSFIDAVVKAGGYPFQIPVTQDLNHLRALYDVADCILLTGGNDDVDPSLYGEALCVDYDHQCMWSTNPVLDRMEIALCQWAYADEKPVFGVCRGMQVMNVALGGSLYQDLPMQKGVNHDHFLRGDSQTLTRLAHEIIIEPQSVLGKLLGVSTLWVNSMHHQAVKELGRGLRAVAHSPEGVIEAIEVVEGQQFFLGVQSHPEILCVERDNRWQTCFDALIDAAQRNEHSVGTSLKSSSRVMNL
jgi:putative glutamine amidotransferase